MSNDEHEKFQELVKNLRADEKANAIVCFCEGLTVRKLLRAIKYLNLTGQFAFIGSDGWADRQFVITDYEPQAVGSISIRIHSHYVESFDDYYLRLNPFDNHRNPWFREFWENKFQCKMPDQRPSIKTLFQSSDRNETDFIGPKQIPFCTGA